MGCGEETGETDTDRPDATTLFRVYLNYKELRTIVAAMQFRQ
jgi:hypothetical protein